MRTTLTTALLSFAAAASAVGQAAPPPTDVVLPQRGTLGPDGEIVLTGVRVGVVVDDRVARTTMEVTIANTGERVRDVEFVVPVPDGATTVAFDFHGSEAEPTARLLPADEARRTYDEIVGRLRDPALLEFMGSAAVRSSVFPVGPGDRQRLRLSYEHVLSGGSRRIDYALPRSELLSVAVPWELSLTVKTKAAIAAVHSPTHRFERIDVSRHEVALRVPEKAAREPGPILLSVLLDGEGVASSFTACPDPDRAGGTFLLVVAPPRPVEGGPVAARELTLVIDRSGSMKGAKLDQVTDAAKEIVRRLGPAESFRLVAYASSVDVLSGPALDATPENVARAEGWLDALHANGGTDVLAGLREALAAAPTPGRVPYVLFLTDGQPTVGVTDEAAIRAAAAAENRHGHRILALGVGADVNTALLRDVATVARGSAFFILPGERAGPKIERTFDRMRDPILTGLSLGVVDAVGDDARHRLLDLEPPVLPDLFAGDEVVVTGRYRGTEPLRFRLEGDHGDRRRTFDLAVRLDDASPSAAYVRRLWAGRRIAGLVDAIRALGAGTASDDPRFVELLTEVVRLSREHGILTEYTAFFASAGTDLRDPDRILEEAERAFRRRAMAVRTGTGAINQDVNLRLSRLGGRLNRRNAFYDERLFRREFAGVQQIHDLTFYRRGSTWIDARLLDRPRDLTQATEVRFGTDSHRALVDRLAADGRPGLLALGDDVLLLLGPKAVRLRADPAP